jgi:hypothetical protein
MHYSPSLSLEQLADKNKMTIDYESEEEKKISLS